MVAIAAKMAGNTGGSPPSGSVTLGDLAPLPAFTVIGNETAASGTPTAVKMMMVPGYATTATAALTTTLTNLSKGIQRFTGATTQTIVLPVVSTLPQTGFGYWIINDSSGALTVNSSGANLVQTIAAGSRAWIFAILLTGTTAASWDAIYTPLVSTTVADSDPNPVTGNAVFDAIAAAVLGLYDDRGNFDASESNFPSSGGSGAAGAILKGDIWTVSVAGVLGGVSVSLGDTVRALVDTPGQTGSNWAVAEANLGYTPVSQSTPTFDKTVTPPGTTGAQTINKPTGAVNFAAAATSLVVTNSLVLTSSIITATVGTNDTTMKSCAAVAASGSFTLFPNAAPTAETRVDFRVSN